MGPGHTIGQTIGVGPAGLSGLQVRPVFAKGPVSLPLRLRIWGREGGGFRRSLGELTHTFDLSQSLQRIAWSFAPIPGTAGQEVLITIELLEPPAQEVALGCHRYDPADPRGDAYPEGRALVDGTPVPADLYFISY